MNSATAAWVGMYDETLLTKLGNVPMKNTVLNPETLFNSVQMGYSHAVKSTGSETIHCAGQVAWDDQCNLIGENDIEKQARQALVNLKRVLESAGADKADIVRLRTYVVNLNPSLLEPIGKAIGEFYEAAVPAANTLIGVQSLALPEFLIEIEATAVKS